MGKKATCKKGPNRGANGAANGNNKVRENAPLKAIKQIGRPSKTPTGKGLGKAGAKRLGRLLKRAIQDQEQPVRGKVSLPKTPVRLLKHQIQTKAENAPKTHTAKPASPHVPQLILSVVSQCKHRGGISMAELKKTLAAAGYDVTKNNRRVNVVTQRLVNNETLVRTTRNASFRINNKKQTDAKHVRTGSVKSPKPKGDLKQSKTASKSPEGAEKSQRKVRKTPKAKGKTRRAQAKSHKPKGKTRRTAAKSHKPKGKTRKPAARSHKPKGKTRKPAARSHKPKGKTRKPAARSHKPKGKTRKPAARSHKPKGKTRKPAAKSHKPRQKTPKARRKSPKPAGNKRRPATNRVAPRKAQRALRRRPKQTRHPYKSSWRRQPQRRRPGLKTQQHQVARRRAYYY